MAFTQKLLSFTFVLTKGSFQDSPQNNTVTLSGLRASATITATGGPSLSTASIRIFGMTFSQMNDLMTLGLIPTLYSKNSVTVLAGDSSGPLAQAFQGTIYNAWGDFNSQPDVPFIVESQGVLLDALKPAQTISIKGSADVATMLSGLANQMGLTFENNGVTAKIANPYYSGDAITQARQIVAAAGIEWNACYNGVLAIWPAGSSLNTPNIPVISPSTGMIGYPTFTQNGIRVRNVYNPGVDFGRRINVQDSQLTAANGTWTVSTLVHTLETQVEHGKWESAIEANPVGYGVTVPSMAP